MLLVLLISSCHVRLLNLLSLTTFIHFPGRPCLPPTQELNLLPAIMKLFVIAAIVAAIEADPIPCKCIPGQPLDRDQPIAHCGEPLSSAIFSPYTWP